MRARQVVLVAVVVGSVVGVAYGAAATPGSGTTRENLATAAVTEGGMLPAADKSGVVADAVTVAPGGTSGWHTHPEPELVLVKSGELTFYRSDKAGCAGRTFGAGEAFVGPPGGVPQMATNTGQVPTELVVVFFGIHEGEVRHDMEVPAGCPAS